MIRRELPLTVIDVSIVELLANPLRYDGKQVQVIGFLRREFEGDAIYLHHEDFEYAISKNAIWLDRPKDFSEKQTSEVDKKYVICEGTLQCRGTRPYGNVQWIANTHYSIGVVGTGTTKRLNLCHLGEIGLESSRCSPAG
jgi:hypothetical protein